MICIIEGCSKPAFARGWCKRCYKRHYRHGDPSKTLVRPLAERLEAKIEKTDSCWLWLACCDTAGYGLIRYQGKMPKVHRLLWEEAHGPIPADRELHHRCEVCRCVNPAHLEALTRLEHRQRHKR